MCIRDRIWTPRLSNSVWIAAFTFLAVPTGTVPVSYTHLDVYKRQIEKYAAGMQPLSYLQFQRIGYFNVDKDSTPEKMVFNRTVGLKDVWGKINK